MIDPRHVSVIDRAALIAGVTTATTTTAMGR